jgi:hypothetical protein
MKLVLLFILYSSVWITFAQKEKKFINQPDSIRVSIKEDIIPPIEVKPNFYIPLRAVNSFPLSLRLGLHSFSPMLEDNYELNTDLLYPAMPLAEQNKLSFLYSMLGAVQTGAVGYLAYKHIKKFGLLK